MSDEWALHEELALELEAGADTTEVASRLGIDPEEARDVDAALSALQGALAFDEVAEDEGPVERIGDYEVSEVLGHGAFGTVYRARDPLLDVEVAIKLINVPPGAQEEVNERFQREARTVAKLDHPGVVNIRSAGVDEGRPFLVLDLVPGTSLQDRLDEDGPLPLRRAAEVVHALALALEHAHIHGVVHRDVKPDNVLLTTDGRPLLTDFGLAKDALAQSGAQLTQEGHYLGTPGYWPPEQARGDLDAIGPHSDVYGLGATLYALLTGRAPFVGRSVLGILESMSREGAPAPSRLRPEVPAGLEAICLRCLADAPGDRYPSAGALAADLARWLDDPRFAPPRRGSHTRTVALACGFLACGLVTAALFGPERGGAEPVAAQPGLPGTPGIPTPAAVTSASAAEVTSASATEPSAPLPYWQRELRWTERLLSAPPTRSHAGMAFDPKRRQVLLFGGLARRLSLDDLWAYDGERWSELRPEPGTARPPSRSGAAVVFDVARDRLVVLGGRVGNKRKGALEDMWEWDGARWRELALPLEAAKAMRKGVQAVYAPARKVLVVLVARQLWEHDGHGWAPKPAPPGNGSGLVYDQLTERVLLFDQRGLGVWGYDGVSWSMAGPPAPTKARGLLALGAGEAALLFGGQLGQEPEGETWLLHRNRWRRIGDPQPGARAGAAWAWDAARRRVVLFGGARSRKSLLADTWELGPPEGDF